jgi:hypothetical protein
MIEGQPPPPEQLPDWLIAARKRPPEAPVDSIVEISELPTQRGQYEDFLDNLVARELPTSREGVEAYNKDGGRIWLTRAISVKAYGCMCCSNVIDSGAEHVLVRLKRPQRQFNHHHVHKPCGFSLIDPNRPLSVFRDNDISERSIKKRQAQGRRSRRKT